MPKMKTHKGASKRFRVSAKGKVLRKRAFAGHLMSSKSGNRVRGLRKTLGVSAAIEKKMLIALNA